jgi:hypothetical protein
MTRSASMAKCPVLQTGRPRVGTGTTFERFSFGDAAIGGAK